MIAGTSGHAAMVFAPVGRRHTAVRCLQRYGNSWYAGVAIEERIMYRLLLPFLLLTLVGCPAAKLYREGKEYDESGRDYQAALKYVAALDKNEKLKKPREALVAVAEDAYKEKLGLAEGYERDGRFPAALDEYRGLDQLLDRMGDYDAVSFTVIDVRKKVEEMANAAAEERYRAGESALAARKWSEAVEEYGAAQGFKAGYKDTKEKVGVAYYGWAEDDLARKAFRDSATHFQNATESAGTGFKDAAARGGATYRALGNYFVTADRCRQAVKDLRAAQRLLGAGKVDGELATAEECAVTPVAIMPFDNPTGTNLAGMAMGDTIADGIGSQVRANASEFVKLIERSALDSILAEQGLSASGVTSGSTAKIRGVRYLVLGKLTQVRLDKPSPSKESKTAAATSPYKCQKTNKDGGTYEGTCFNSVTLSYKEIEAKIAVRVVGTVRVVDVKSGEQLTTLALEGSAEDAVHYADDFSVGGKGVSSGDITLREHTDGYGVDGDLRNLAVKARQDLASEDDLTQTVLKKLVGDSTKAVLSAVDIEREAVDPGSLKIVP